MVIPTLQKSDLLAEVVALFADSPVVSEVLVINNAPEPLRFASAKVRVLQQQENIFVNPAWNLGVREAREDYVIIANDDISFQPQILPWLAAHISPRVGLIGAPNGDYLGHPRRRPSLRPIYQRRYAYGTFLAFPKSSWLTVPQELRIFYGDDYVFNRQQRRNYILHGAQFRSPMGVSSTSDEAQRIRWIDDAAWNRSYALERPYQARFAAEARAHRAIKSGLSAARHLAARVRAQRERFRAQRDRTTTG